MTVSKSMFVRPTTSILTLLHPTLIKRDQEPTERNIATIFCGSDIRQKGMSLTPRDNCTLVQYVIVTIVQVVSERAPDGGNALQRLFLSHRSASSSGCAGRPRWSRTRSEQARRATRPTPRRSTRRGPEQPPEHPTGSPSG